MGDTGKSLELLENTALGEPELLPVDGWWIALALLPSCFLSAVLWQLHLIPEISSGFGDMQRRGNDMYPVERLTCMVLPVCVVLN